MGNVTMPTGPPLTTLPNGASTISLASGATTATGVPTTTKLITASPGIHYTCHDYFLDGFGDGVYAININGTDVNVYCKMYRNSSVEDPVRNGGWTVILRCVVKLKTTFMKRF